MKMRWKFKESERGEEKEARMERKRKRGGTKIRTKRRRSGGKV